MSENDTPTTWVFSDGTTVTLETYHEPKVDIEPDADAQHTSGKSPAVETEQAEGAETLLRGEWRLNGSAKT